MAEISKEKKKRMKKDIYLALAKYFLIFFSFAVASSLLGRFVDNTFDIRPFGTLGFMGLSMILSWVVVFMTYKSMTSVPEDKQKDKNGE